MSEVLDAGGDGVSTTKSVVSFGKYILKLIWSKFGSLVSELYLFIHVNCTCSYLSAQTFEVSRISIPLLLEKMQDIGYVSWIVNVADESALVNGFGLLSFCWVPYKHSFGNWHRLPVWLILICPFWCSLFINAAMVAQTELCLFSQLLKTSQCGAASLQYLRTVLQDVPLCASSLDVGRALQPEQHLVVMQSNREDWLAPVHGVVAAAQGALGRGVHSVTTDQVCMVCMLVRELLLCQNVFGRRKVEWC